MHARGRRTLLRWVWPMPRTGVVLAAAALAAWEGAQGRFSLASHASILVVVGAVLVLAVVTGRGRQRTPSRTWVRCALRALGPLFSSGRVGSAVVAGTLVWVLLIAATIGWDAASFAKQQHDLPTLSRLVGDVTDHDWGRALVFAAWLALGIYLAIACRRPRAGWSTESVGAAGAASAAGATSAAGAGRDGADDTGPESTDWGGGA